MTNFLYFAYGSNMLTERLVARCPGAKPVGVAYAPDHAVSYCLVGSDGSAKAGIIREIGSEAWGVLFEVPWAEQPILDRFEGTPDLYQREQLDVVRMEDGQSVTAVTYRPQPGYISHSKKPYDWYRALCLGGAMQHKMPPHAHAALAAVAAANAAEIGASHEEGREHALAALKAAGLLGDDGSLSV